MTSSTMPYSLACVGRQDRVALDVGLDLLDGLPGVLGQDLLEQRAHPQDLVGLDLEVGDLPLALARRAGGSGSATFCSANRLPFVPAASSTAAAEAAWPMQIVWISGRT